MRPLALSIYDELNLCGSEENLLAVHASLANLADTKDGPLLMALETQLKTHQLLHCSAQSKYEAGNTLDLDSLNSLQCFIEPEKGELVDLIDVRPRSIAKQSMERCGYRSSPLIVSRSKTLVTAYFFIVETAPELHQ